MKNQRNEAEVLAARPYVIVAEPSETTDNEPSWMAYVMELDGCIGQGMTKEEAIADVKLAMIDFIETMLEYGVRVPEPQRPRTSTAGTKINIFESNQPNPSNKRDETRRVGEFVLSTTGIV